LFESAPNPYLWLMDPDSGGPETFGFPTLLSTQLKIQMFFYFEEHWGGNWVVVDQEGS